MEKHLQLESFVNNLGILDGLGSFFGNVTSIRVLGSRSFDGLG